MLAKVILLLMAVMIVTSGVTASSNADLYARAKVLCDQGGWLARTTCNGALTLKPYLDENALTQCERCKKLGPSCVGNIIGKQYSADEIAYAAQLDEEPLIVDALYKMGKKIIGPVPPANDGKHDGKDAALRYCELIHAGVQKECMDVVQSASFFEKKPVETCGVLQRGHANSLDQLACIKLIRNRHFDISKLPECDNLSLLHSEVLQCINRAVID